MNKKLSKFMAYLLIAVFIFFIFSCTAESPKEKEQNEIITTNPNETEILTETEIKDSLPEDLNFGGKTINVYASASAGGFDIMSETGDLLNDAVFRRTLAVEERLNLKMNAVFEADSADFNSNTPVTKIRASMAAGDRTFDLVGGWSQKLAPLALEGLFLDMHKVPYLTLSEPWWNDSLLKEMTISGKLYFTSGDIFQYFLQQTQIVFFNKSIMNEYQLPDLYGVVKDNKWTINYMNEVVKDVYQDINGDGVRGTEDLYGMIFEYSAANLFMPATNNQLIKVGSDGYPRIEPDHERIIGLVEKVYNLFYENTGTMSARVGGDINFGIIAENRAMIWIKRLFDAAYYYRNFEFDYGIIPLPKYNETQDSYYSEIGYLVPFLAVPNNVEDLELVGAFMEAMASESYKKVTPVFFDIVMEVKIAHDDQMPEMLNLIRSGAYMRFETVYNNSVGNAGDMMESLIGNKSKDFASWFEKNESRINTAIDKLVEKIEALD